MSGQNQYDRPQGWRFQFHGVNVRSTPDSLPANKYPSALNIRAYSGNSVQTRPGYVPYAGGNGVIITDIEPFAAIQTDDTPVYLFRDGAGRVYGNNTLITTLAGTQNPGVRMIPFRPPSSPQSYVYVPDANDYQKIVLNNNNFSASKVGVAEPQSPCEAVPGPLGFTYVIVPANTWAYGGSTTSAPVDGNRSTDTVGSNFADPAGGNRTSLVVSSTQQYQPGQVLTNGNLYYVVLDVLPPAANMTVVAVYTEPSGNNYVIVPSQLPVGQSSPIPGIGYLRRGAIADINGPAYFVKSVVEGPDGSQSVVVATTGSVGAGNSFSPQPTIIVDGPISGTITSAYVAANFSAGVGFMTANLAASPFATTIAANTGKAQLEDYVHFSINVSDVTQVLSLELRFNVDATDTTVTRNYYYYSLNPSVLASTATGSGTQLDGQAAASLQSSLASQLANTQNLLAQAQTGTGQYESIPFDQRSQAITGLTQSVGQIQNQLQTVAGSTVAGASQWTEIMVPISSLNRIGGDTSRTLENCNQVSLRVNTTGASLVGWVKLTSYSLNQEILDPSGHTQKVTGPGVSGNTPPTWNDAGGTTTDGTVTWTDQGIISQVITVAISSIWVGGGGQPDVGAYGTPYRYRAVPFSSITGAMGNPSPDMRYGVMPRRQYVIVDLPSASYDSQIDTWLIYRYGGSVNTWHFIGSAPSSTSVFTDSYFDDTALKGDPLIFDNFEPYPGVGLPVSVSSNNSAITCVGQVITVTGNNFSPASVTSWLPGTLIKVGGKATFTLFNRPVGISGGYQFNVQESTGSANGTNFQVIEPRIAWTHAPWSWGPDSAGTIFSVGDKLRPGVVYFAKANSPDAAADDSTELSAPSEPLLGGEIIGGVSFLSSTSQWWGLYPAFNSAKRYSPSAIPVGRAVISPYGVCSDGARIYFWAKDCIAVHSGGRYEDLTSADLLPLFPHDGIQGADRTRSGTTYYAPDYSRASTFRLAVIHNVLYADYEDSAGFPRHLVCDLATGAWSQDAYADPITCRAGNPQQVSALAPGSPTLYPQCIMGDSHGKGWQQQFGVGDNANSVQGQLSVFEWDGGDLRAQPQWGDMYFDGAVPNGMNVTPTSLGANAFTSTVLAGNNNRSFYQISLGGSLITKFLGARFDWTDYPNNSSNGTTFLNLWQSSKLTQPDTSNDRFTDWFPFEGAFYVRGVILTVDTFAANKTIIFRNGDNNTVASNNVVNASGETQIALSFNPPVVAHQIRIEPQNSAVPWRFFRVDRWLGERWPELLPEYSAFINLGTPGTKYLTGAVIPLETNNSNVTIQFVSSDGNNITITANTQPNIKTPVPFAFGVPLIGHEFQLRPANNSSVRIWFEEALWNFKQWPEYIPEASQWFPIGDAGPKYLRGASIPLDTGGNNVSINFRASDGGNQSLTANTAAGNKTVIDFAFTVPLIGHQFQLVPSANNSVRIWWEEIKWRVDPWPPLTTEVSPWMTLGAVGAKYLRGAVIPTDSNGANCSLTLFSSDGGNVTIGPFNTPSGQKTDVPWPFAVPLIGHEFQLRPANNCRVWYDQIRWDFEPWPERIAEASAWFPIGDHSTKYLLGCSIPLDTGGNNATLLFRSSDGGNQTFTVSTTANQKTSVDIAFTVPLIGHEWQIVPQNSSVRVWWEEIRWRVDPWPPLTTEASPWMNLGFQGAKYLRGVVIPVDSKNNSVSLTLISSDGGNNVTIGPFTTAPGQKTDVAAAFNVPLIGHEFQLIPSNNCRVWYDKIRWDFDQWPELISEASAWFPIGDHSVKYLLGCSVPLDTGGNAATLLFRSSDGGNQSFTITTTASQKTSVDFAFTVPLIGHEWQIVPQNSNVRIWWEEIRWRVDPWPPLTVEASPWMNLGFPGAKYLRGAVIPVDSNGAAASLTLISSDGGNNVTIGPFTSTAGRKTDIPAAFGVPLIGHEFQIIPASNCRVWYDKIRWDFDQWPELINEATGWLKIFPDGSAAYLQGMILVVESNAAALALNLYFDDGTSVTLSPILTPVAAIKTPVPFSLFAPKICHAVQIIPSAPCRIWTDEIKWIAEHTPEPAYTWKSQPTSHGFSGFHHVIRIELSYASTTNGALTVTATDGTSPVGVPIANTGGVKVRTQFVFSPNKGQQFQYAIVFAGGAGQVFWQETIVWTKEWGSAGPYNQYKQIGGDFSEDVKI